MKLKEAGLVKGKKQGLYVKYSLTYKKAAKIAELITNFSREVQL